MSQNICIDATTLIQQFQGSRRIQNFSPLNEREIDQVNCTHNANLRFNALYLKFGGYLSIWCHPGSSTSSRCNICNRSKKAQNASIPKCNRSGGKPIGACGRSSLIFIFKCKSDLFRTQFWLKIEIFLTYIENRTFSDPIFAKNWIFSDLI